MVDFSVYFYLYLLIFICSGLIGWGLIKLDRIYQYPFVMGSIISAFIIPQCFALINNPEPVSQEALSRVFLMSCLCAFMSWLGYQFPINRGFIKKLNISVDYNKIFYGGIFLVAVAYLAHFLILQLPAEVQENTQWTGVVTIYAFFRNLIYPGFAILLIMTTRKPSTNNLIATAISAIIPLQVIIFQGRREPTAVFILTIVICLYYFYRYLPPRWLVVGALVFALLIIPLTGNYREIAKSGNWNELTELNPVENMQDYVMEGEILELKNGALLMDAAVRTGRHGYGTGNWNRFVDSFIPGQIIGRQFKKSLKAQGARYNLSYLYRYRFQTGTTSTGIADSFVEFDYFGCLFFFFVAYMFKNLWVSAIYNRSFFSQIVYITLITASLLWVTHGTGRFLSDIVFCGVFIGGIFVYARRQPQQQFVTRPRTRILVRNHK